VQRGRPQKSFTYFSCTVFSILWNKRAVEN
jgi:hypothetical protein